MNPRLSIILCTFNPDPAVIGRSLSAVAAAQRATPFDIEVILVDNNSDPPLSGSEFVAQFLGDGPARRLTAERRAGLTNARLAGFASSRAPALVFIDDDNVPAPEYFSAAADLLGRFPDVGVLGPGIVQVEWEGDVSRWIRGYATCFQEKRMASARFDRVAGWPDFYPTGTGMIVRREVLTEYARQVTAGGITASGRKGRQLTSGEDAQIVWTAVRMGLAAGTSPELRLTHCVERRKATLGYILRMVFATMASGRIAMRQSFPERPELWTPPRPLSAHASILRTALGELLKLHVRSGPVQIIRLMGDLHGQFLAAEREPPWVTRLAAKWLGFAWADR